MIGSAGISMPDTYFLRSFGCQMNDHDAERIAGLLENLGLRRVGSAQDAHLLVYNTCSIREKADSRLAGHLSLAMRLKREGSARLIVVTGCLPQSRQDDLFADFPFVDILAGPQSLHELPRLIEDRLTSNRQTSAFQDHTSTWSADLPRSRVPGPAAWIQIVAGCSNFCSYCIVPYVRGPEASRPADAIVEEVAALVKEGVRQVTLLGQNVNAYGKELGIAGHEDFPHLLRRTCSIAGLERVRFMTSHPKDMSGALIDVMAEENQVCEHLHLPVQSGSDRILAAMHRGYDRAHYLNLVEQLRAAVPDLALTTDFIVGFPGETERDFADTLALVEECGFDGAFTFIYSPRRQTEAARMSNWVDPAVAEERLQRLLDSVQRTAYARNQALVGRVLEVMVERPSRQNPGEVMGRIRAHKPVNFPSRARPGDLVRVELLEATSTSFRGRQVS
ncbi:MAG: tRNA (N6-isopentenyl adenosine(37)-C2)-methylthiotransferase MiaB [Thermoleophilia bacterium]|jgi:tRNA-2-methylthio-N6-dimethylallyladenosine synthase